METILARTQPHNPSPGLPKLRKHIYPTSLPSPVKAPFSASPHPTKYIKHQDPHYTIFKTSFVFLNYT